MLTFCSCNYLHILSFGIAAFLLPCIELCAFKKSLDFAEPTFLSCSKALEYNDGRAGYYSIQRRNMAHAIVVECKIIDGKTYAILHHDSEVTKIVTGYEGPGSFKYELII